VTDEDVALTFGFFDGTLEELRTCSVRARPAPVARPARWRRTSRRSLLDGSYEVIDEIAP
jgi:hypothetical protein